MVLIISFEVLITSNLLPVEWANWALSTGLNPPGWCHVGLNWQLQKGSVSPLKGSSMQDGESSLVGLVLSVSMDNGFSRGGLPPYWTLGTPRYHPGIQITHHRILYRSKTCWAPCSCVEPCGCRGLDFELQNFNRELIRRIADSTPWTKSWSLRAQTNSQEPGWGFGSLHD